MRTTYRLLCVCMAVLALIACGKKGTDKDASTSEQDVAEVQQEQVGELDRIHSVGQLYIASQPTVEDLKKLKDMGIVSVLNLRPADETPDLNEREEVEKLGLTYVNVPLASAEDANEAFFTEARKKLKSVKRPMLLHCSSANRAGSAWLTYRVLDEGVSLEQAVKEAKQVGMSSDTLEERAKEYINKQK